MGPHQGRMDHVHATEVVFDVAFDQTKPSVAPVPQMMDAEAPIPPHRVTDPVGASSVLYDDYKSAFSFRVSNGNSVAPA